MSRRVPARATFSQFSAENPYELHLSRVMKVWVYEDPQDHTLKFKTTHNKERGLKPGKHHPFVEKIWEELELSVGHPIPVTRQIQLDRPVPVEAVRDKAAQRRPVVTDHDMIGRARQLRAEGPASRKICILNPMNETLVGGGAFCGAPNFEESLFRIGRGYALSMLAKSIAHNNLTGADPNAHSGGAASRPTYTENHTQDQAAFYTDGVVITHEITTQPGQKWEDHGYAPLRDGGFAVDIVGNASVPLAEPRQTAQHKNLIMSKIKAQLHAAKQKGVTDLLLTDFGCGGFNNDPALIAQWYAEAIAEGGYDQIMNIEFCVKSAKNFPIFKAHFDKKMTELMPPLMVQQGESVVAAGQAVGAEVVTVRTTPQEKIQALQRLAENTPRFQMVSLQSASSDDLIVVTLNVCAPFSPIGPDQRPEGTVLLDGVEKPLCDLERFDLHPDYHQLQMKKMAAYVFELLKAGADLLPLQEVPDPHGDANNYRYFVDSLVQLVEGHRVSRSLPVITFNKANFEHSLQHTQGTRSCTGVIANEARVNPVINPVPCLNHRAAQYEIETVTGKKVTLVNMHADLEKQQDTLDFIARSFVRGYIIAGDPNLTKARLQLPGESGGSTYHHDIACCPRSSDVMRFDTNDALSPVPLKFPAGNFCVCIGKNNALLDYQDARGELPRFFASTRKTKLSAADKLLELSQGKPQVFTRIELNFILEKHLPPRGDSELRKAFVAAFPDKVSVLEAKIAGFPADRDDVSITPQELGIAEAAQMPSAARGS